MAAPKQNATPKASRDSQFFERQLEDRVHPTTEDLENALDPDRTPETVRYPDPVAPPLGPGDVRPGDTGSIADIEMARRTDAGNDSRVDRNINKGYGPGLIGIGIAVAILVILVLVFALM